MTGPPPLPLGSRRTLAARLREVAERIATSVAAAWLDAHPSRRGDGGDGQPRRVFDDTRHHLGALAGAIEAGSPAAFGHHVGWARRLIEARGGHRAELAEHLGDLFDCSAEALGDSAGAALLPWRAEATVELATPGPRRAPAGHAHADRRRSYVTAALEGDRRRALAVCQEALEAGATLAGLYTEVIAPAQREVGCAWEGARISVAHEHVATAVAQFVLSTLYADRVRRSAAPAPRLGRAIVAAIQSEQHQLGAHMVADLLEAGGWEVRFAGAQVPVQSLLAFAAEDRPDLIALSVTMVTSVPDAIETVAALDARFGLARPALLLGGRMLELAPHLAEELGAEGSAAADAAAAVTVARDLVAARR